MHPVVKLFIKIQELEDTYVTDFNANVAWVKQTYDEFLANPGQSTPMKLVNYVKEALNQLYHGDFYGDTPDRRLSQIYLKNIARMTRDVVDSMALLGDTTTGSLPGFDKIQNDLLKHNSQSISYSNFLKQSMTNNDDEQDIIEDQVNSLNTVDYGIDRYQEALAESEKLNNQYKSVSDHYSSKNRKIPPKSRPYRGTNARQIVDHAPILNEDKKDFNYPKPGVITGQVRDVPLVNMYPDIKFRYS